MSMSVHDNYFDIYANSLLAATFGHPSDVLASDILSRSEKRCVLAAWASDAFAVEGKLWLRQIAWLAGPSPRRADPAEFDTIRRRRRRSAPAPWRRRPPVSCS
jgi:hypothetical protein